jgi:beta-glucosidase
MSASFPQGFIWGTATAAHQVEGGNWNNDWWAWENNPDSGCVEPSGDACNHWDMYEHDLDLLAGFGFNAYRFSIEWSRIEPEDGLWSRSAIEHYRRACEACLARGVTPMVTFHHFTTPRWVAHHGGWEEPTTADRFAVFCHRAAEHLGDLMRYAFTFNEPNMVATHGYLTGGFPPGRRDPALRRAVNDIFVDAHHKARAANKAAAPDVPVGLTLAMQDNQALPGGEQYRDRVRRNLEDVFLDAAREDDFIGVQCYTRARFGPDGNVAPEDGVPRTQMGYEVWPEALEACIRRADEMTHGVPVIVTENGIGTADDAQRIDYVTRALNGVHQCMADGIDVRGYVYWSLLDNFEWALGYMPTFGLVAVDRHSFERQPKPSASWLGQIAKANAI